MSVLHLATAGCCSPPQPALLRFYQRSPECLYSIRLQQGVVHLHNQHRSVSISDPPSVCTPSDYSRVLFTSTTSIAPFLSAIARVSVLHQTTAGCCSPPQPASLRFYQRSPECLYSIRLQQGVVHLRNQHPSVSISDHPSVHLTTVFKLLLLFFQKCDGLVQPEYKKLCVDPQLTSFDILKNLLAQAFGING